MDTLENLKKVNEEFYKFLENSPVFVKKYEERGFVNITNNQMIWFPYFQLNGENLRVAEFKPNADVNETFFRLIKTNDYFQIKNRAMSVSEIEAYKDFVDYLAELIKNKKDILLNSPSSPKL